jgi:CubicO group peptidase (beta-lactamase class C family)
MRRAVQLIALLLVVIVIAARAAQPDQTPNDPTPATLDEFRATAARILEETGVPGAGIALVRSDGVEWTGGIGLADRDRKTPVTEDTHFRVGSISKTFVAMALVQLYEDGMIDFNAPLREVAPEVGVENPWEDTHPIRILNVLQHTAGFDDMHFNERYNLTDPPLMPLADELKINPHSRRARWPPGTRMSYSNPGYGVIGYLVEKIAGEPYEEYIDREIFAPLKMYTSSFRLTHGDEQLLAQGYDGRTGPPVGFPQIYLRPSGNLHSSPKEMARFIQMLLNWGELGEAAVVDPEYLGQMESPRTTLAAVRGLKNGYGNAIFSTLTLPYRVIGHNGGIDGFLSDFAYSPSRDVGYVILLNSTAAEAGAAINRLSSIAIRYLKRDIEPPEKPEMKLAESALKQFEGYYVDANPRNQIIWFIQKPLAGRSVTLEGGRLVMRQFLGEPMPLIPVSETLFRLENEIEASRVFTTDDNGTMVMAGMQLYAERTPRWRVELLRGALFTGIVIVFSPLLAAIFWLARVRVAKPRFFGEVKGAMFLGAIALMAPFVSLGVTDSKLWGTQNSGTVTVFVATLLFPSMAILIAFLAINARREGASRALIGYAIIVALAIAGLSQYLWEHGLIGIRLWNY